MAVQGCLALLPEVPVWFQDDLRLTLPTESDHIPIMNSYVVQSQLYCFSVVFRIHPFIGLKITFAAAPIFQRKIHSEV